MFVIINAFKSITRSKGRNILIGIIVLAIAASSCVALAIRNAAEEAQASGAESLTITGSIMLDRQSLMESGGTGDMNAMRELMMKYQDLELEELLTYTDSDYIKDFYYSNSVSLNAGGGLEAYGSVGGDDNENDTDFEGDAAVPYMGGGQVSGGMSADGERFVGRPIMVMGGMAMGDFTVSGYSSEGAMTKFVNGSATVTDGEMFDTSASDMNCLISNELAVFNGLSVGDTIELTNPSDSASDDEVYNLTIVGIYNDSGASDTGGMPMFSTSQDPANLICISYGSLQKIIEHSESVAVVTEQDMGFDVVEISSALNGRPSFTFAFSSPENYEAFGAELTDKGLSEYYVLTSSNLSNYKAGLLPLENLSEFAMTLLLIVLAIGGVILIVINVFNIRERKYEVGVLTAIGVKKGKVAMQFVTELLCVTFIAIIIGAGVGSVVSVPVANNLLSAQIEQEHLLENETERNFGRPDGGVRIEGNGRGDGNTSFVGGGPARMMSVFNPETTQEVTYLDKINATVYPLILFRLILIGIGLTIVSSLAAVIFVMRYEPLKILANRS